jgi:hypothetical protein
MTWDEYFAHIQGVCPWSNTAWNQNEIEIVKWQGTELPLGTLQARIYTVDLNRRRLKKLCKQLDVSEHDEWLWSEPTYGKYAAPQPILIQQHRKTLNDIRKRLKKHGL